MAARKLHTSSELNQLLRYESDTGKLYWKHRPVEYFKSPRSAKIWNTKFSGKEALIADNGKGYRIGCIEYKHYLAHRVIWCMVFGYWPEEIDHINLNKADNRLSNLRDVSHIVNLANQPLRATNTTGLANITWDKARSQWLVMMRRYGTRHIIGRFSCISRAVKARNRAELKIKNLQSKAIAAG